MDGEIKNVTQAFTVNKCNKNPVKASGIINRTEMMAPLYKTHYRYRDGGREISVTVRLQSCALARFTRHRASVGAEQPVTTQQLGDDVTHFQSGKSPRDKWTCPGKGGRWVTLK